MTVAVIFVEEESAKIDVDVLAQRILSDRSVKVLSHEGKSDLKSSFPRKIGSWQHPARVPFIVLHDNDGGDCEKLKKRLIGLVPPQRRPRTHIRIVMQCLECWYLADPRALAKADLIKSAKAEDMLRAARFRDPDRLVSAKQEFFRLHDQPGQLALARAIAPYLDIGNQRSRSFALFVRTLQNLVDPDR
jgi:hypothetical protein